MPSRVVQTAFDRLTARQRQCLKLAARHWTSKAIGRQLAISPKTVDRHIEEAVRKLEVGDRSSAVRLLLALDATDAPAPGAIPEDGNEPQRERPPCRLPPSPGRFWSVTPGGSMGKAILMFTWTDVRDALETLADTSQQRKVAWLMEGLKRASQDMPSDELLVEIISSAILLGAERPVEALGLPSLLAT